MTPIKWEGDSLQYVQFNFHECCSLPTSVEVYSAGRHVHISALQSDSIQASCKMLECVLGRHSRGVPNLISGDKVASYWTAGDGTQAQKRPGKGRC